MKTMNRFFLVLLAGVFLLALAGCESSSVSANKAEDSSGLLTIGVPSGHVFDLPADRFNLTSSGARDRYKSANITILETDNFTASKKRFERNYCEGYSYSSNDSSREAILPQTGLKAVVTKSRLSISGNWRTVTYAYVPEIHLLVIFSPSGKDASNGEIVEIWEKTFRKVS